MTHELRATVGYPDLGINVGDSLIVKQQTTAEPGDLVVALTESGVTVCRYAPGVDVIGLVLEVAGRRS